MLTDQVQNKPENVTVQYIRVGGVETLPASHPALAEQQSIVTNVDEIMVLCDQLETQLTTTQTDSRRLLETLAPPLEEVG